MVRETVLDPTAFIAPLFISDHVTQPTPISSMPGVVHHTVESAVDEVTDLAALGISAVLLFGLPAEKDANGSAAYAADGPVQRALRAIKQSSPKTVVIADLCLCQYTDHGHCGLLTDTGKVDNDNTVKQLTKVALSQAAAGADLVAPSDMMDGRIEAIRTALDSAEYTSVGTLSYAAKYASAFYGPFRSAAESAPLVGDRREYQMDPANSREALREVELDIAEGADIVMVKPALAYLDVISKLRERVSAPIAAYSVSGEYAMIEAAAAAGHLDRQTAVLESLLSMRRAGADLIVTYHAKEAAKWLQ